MLDSYRLQSKKSEQINKKFVSSNSQSLFKGVASTLEKPSSSFSHNDMLAKK